MATNRKLAKLAKEWKAAKEAERAATDKRLAVEGQMIDLLGKEVPNKGTWRGEGLKITTGYNDKWDQDLLQEAKDKWPEEWPISFPAREELKVDGRAASIIREKMPEGWKLLKPALTQEPKKPSFEND